MTLLRSNVFHLGSLGSLVLGTGWLLAAAACDAKVIALGPGNPVTDGGTDSGQGDLPAEAGAGDLTDGSPVDVADAGPTAPPFPAIDGATRIADLSPAQEQSLCDWLVADGEAVSGSSAVDSPSIGGDCPSAPGFFACSTQSPRLFFRPLLGPKLCIQNLRHSACQGTIGALQSCLAVFDAAEGAGFHGVTGPHSCPNADTTCQPFYAADGCEETVMQFAAEMVTSSTTWLLAIPVTPGATCIMPQDDGGPDAAAAADAAVP